VNTHVTIETRRPGMGRKQLPEEVAAYVREQILLGNLRPGHFLRVERIAEALGVSATPVREGLVALSSDGFVTSVPRRGFMVTSFTRQDIRDLFWVQGQLAGELAGRAAKQITEGEMALLAKAQAECDAAIERGDGVEIAQLGHNFHRIINLAARSERLAQMLGAVVKQLPNPYYASLEAHVEATTSAHAVIFDALSRRDARQARKITERHITDSAEAVIKILEDRGIWENTEAQPGNTSESSSSGPRLSSSANRVGGLS
jgi:DNA-binding GntR family transcriptional regulator